MDDIEKLLSVADARNKYGYYPDNIVCVYTIFTTETRVLILLRIIKFDLELGYDYLLVGFGQDTNNDDTVLAKLTGKPKLRTLASNNSFVWLKFLTDPSRGAEGYEIDVILIQEGNIHGSINLLTFNIYFFRQIFENLKQQIKYGVNIFRPLMLIL